MRHKYQAKQSYSIIYSLCGLMALCFSHVLAAQLDGDDLLLLVPSMIASTKANGGVDCLNEDQQQLLLQHNQVRQTAGMCDGGSFPAVSALTWDCKLGAAAEKHSAYMLLIAELTHTGIGGTSAADRITAEGYQWVFWGENIALGYLNVNAVMAGWLGSVGHCENMRNGNFTQMGAARSTTGNYWTAVFAKPN